MKAGRTRLGGLVFSLALVCARPVLADGKVFAPPVYPKVEIPRQEALISFDKGIETLVLSTTFLGAGTNFGWVVPLPAEPVIHPVAPDLFAGLRGAFQPRLIHGVPRYYVAVLLIAAWAFLGWRAYKDEVPWVVDLPLCLALGAACWFLGKHVVLGLLALAVALYVRMMARSTAAVSLVVLVGMGIVSVSLLGRSLSPARLLVTLRSETEEGEPAGVEVVAVQRVGAFDATTIRATDPRALTGWLERNGYAASPGLEPVLRDYIGRGWVFVASKLRRASAAAADTVLHPLRFDFATDQPVYPLRLTGVDADRPCTIDLYVLGDQRAKARHFRAARCDRIVHSVDHSRTGRQGGLRLGLPGLEQVVDRSTVATKLSAELTPRQMRSDATIQWTGFRPRGGVAYSRSAALTVALNAGVPLAALGWLAVAASRGGWGVDERFVARWRARVLIAALATVGLLYWLLPKVEVVTAG